MTHQLARKLTGTQVRQQFIEFFEQRAGHTFVPSSPVAPLDDPTLLFTNAGMNQFKPIFLGELSPDSPLASVRRATNSQKCIRAGGKHNDLDDVGKDTYHHTFFEMLGNWSFGDYFKAESIQWAWELLTDIWGIDPSRLYATYFEGDPSLGLEPDREAYDLWLKYLPAERIIPGNTCDNFWEMGETGPCGPCSELHYDGRSDERRAQTPGHALVNRDDPDVIEIWNLVFIQMNRLDADRLEPLPAQHVDTGMGLERIVRVLQGKDSNYDTDLFMPLFARIKDVTGAPDYTGSLTVPEDIAYRVIADHVRTLTFAIADGAEPSNEGRGYVLRRILRRAVRFGYQTLGVNEPFLAKLVPTVVETMSDAFPEIATKRQVVIDIIDDEEQSFRRTLESGIRLFNDAASGADTSKPVPAEAAFKLHDTYGFPVDLTILMAEERGMRVDVEGFERLMAEAKERSRKGGAGKAGTGLHLPGSAVAALGKWNIKPTDESAKFLGNKIRARVRAIWNGNDFDENLNSSTSRPTDRFALILDKTNFYPERGGQVADEGRIASSDGEFEVLDVQESGGYVIHIGRLRKGEMRVGNEYELRVDQPRRKKICANHTATHLLNLALKEELGDSVEQKGSLVAPERLRFDYSANKGLDKDAAERIERSVADAIAKQLPVSTQDAPLEQAKQISGLRAVFGEVYPDPVRVVSVGPTVSELLANPSDEQWKNISIEFCGGTHLGNTAEAKQFALLSEEGVAKGVRRVTAVTGDEAANAIKLAGTLFSRLSDCQAVPDELLAAALGKLNGEIEEATIPLVRKLELRAGVTALRERVKKAGKAASSAGREHAVEAARALEPMAGVPAIVEQLDAGGDRDAILAAMDAVRARHDSAAALLVSVDQQEGKVVIVAKVPEALIGKGLKAGDWVRCAAQACGGKGGGRPDSAQGGGTDPSKAQDALDAARALAQEKLF